MSQTRVWSTIFSRDGRRNLKICRSMRGDLRIRVGRSTVILSEQEAKDLLFRLQYDKPVVWQT